MSDMEICRQLANPLAGSCMSHLIVYSEVPSWTTS